MYQIKILKEDFAPYSPLTARKAKTAFWLAQRVCRIFDKSLIFEFQGKQYAFLVGYGWIRLYESIHVK